MSKVSVILQVYNAYQYIKKFIVTGSKTASDIFSKLEGSV